MHSHRYYDVLIYSYRPQDVSADLADEVHFSPSKTGICLPYVLSEQIIAYYETAYAPFNRHKLAQIGNVLMNVSLKYIIYVTLPRLGHYSGKR